MTAALGVNKTKYDAGGSGDNYIAAGNFSSEVLCTVDTYEASALASGSTIAVANLPAGAIIIDMALYFDDLGSSSALTISVGDTNTPALYIPATDVDAAASVARMSKVDGALYKIGTNTGDNVVLMTTAGATTGTVKLIIQFTLGA